MIGKAKLLYCLCLPQKISGNKQTYFITKKIVNEFNTFFANIGINLARTITITKLYLKPMRKLWVQVWSQSHFP